MDVWFIRANGETSHNRPGSKGFVLGERPNYPDRSFNYREDCLAGGFARVGFPSAGDLRGLEWRSKLREVYGDIAPHLVKNLERFAKIRVGDLVVMPTDRAIHDVHFGMVVPNAANPSAKAGSAPYYYHYDIAAGDWFENAHRVPVHWHREASGKWSVVSVPGLGGLWRRSFGQVGVAKDTLTKAALAAGFNLP